MVLAPVSVGAQSSPVHQDRGGVKISGFRRDMAQQVSSDRPARRGIWRYIFAN
jgi:hypothetical protein